MRRASLVRQRLTVLGLLGIVLLGFPVIGLPTGQWQGIPAAYLYLFGAWSAIIACAAWVAEGRGK